MVSEGILLGPFSDEVQSFSNMAFELKGHTPVVWNPEMMLEIVMSCDQALANKAETKM